MRLRALKLNNVGACRSSTRCKLHTKGMVTAGSVVGRGVKVSTEGEINKRGHTGARVVRSTARSEPYVTDGGLRGEQEK